MSVALPTGLLDGAIDLHRHGYPELSFDQRAAREDVADLENCRELGMTAVVLKSHLWPTVGRAYLLGQQVPGLDVLPSITLNAGVGGYAPPMVELAAQQGARVVYLPTWSSAHDVAHGGITKTVTRLLRHSRLDTMPCVETLDSAGRLRPQVRECLEVAAAYGLLVYTGHLSPAEALAVAESGLAPRLVFSHPDSHSVGATWAEAARIADAGALVEVTALGIYPQIGRTTPDELADLVGVVGAQRCVLTSDYFFDWAPFSATMLTDLAAGLAATGVTVPELRTMLVDNPRRMLGLPVPVAVTS
jgi:Family of unknown function (DUF6282)